GRKRPRLGPLSFVEKRDGGGHRIRVFAGETAAQLDQRFENMTERFCEPAAIGLEDVVPSRGGAARYSGDVVKPRACFSEHACSSGGGVDGARDELGRVG